MKMTLSEANISWPILWDESEVFFEADNVFCGELLSYKDKTYVVSVISADRNMALVSPVELSDETRTDFEDLVTCPLCGYKNIDSWELPASDDEHDCGRCGAVLSVEREVSCSYTAVLVDKPAVRVVV